MIVSYTHMYAIIRVDCVSYTATPNGKQYQIVMRKQNLRMDYEHVSGNSADHISKPPSKT